MAVKKKLKHAAIHEMGKEYVERLDALLVKGTSALEAARIIQEEWGFCVHDKRLSLQKRVQRYKKDVLDHHLHTEILTEDGKKIEGKLILKKDDPKINALEAVTELVKLQQYRIQKLYEVEGKMPTLMNSMRSEIRELSILLKQVSDLQFDLGLVQRTPRIVKGDISMAFGDAQEQEEKYKRLIEIKGQREEAVHEVFTILDDILAERDEPIEHESNTAG